MANLSTIGSGTTIRGNIRSEGDLDIHGRVEGSILVEGELLIGATALIQSDVRGRRIIVRGAVSGDIVGDESVVLEDGARVVGDLAAPSIGIRPGALLRGNVSTEGVKALPTRAPAAASRTAPQARAATPPRAVPAPREQPKPVARAAPPPPAPRAPVKAPTPRVVEPPAEVVAAKVAIPRAEASSQGAGGPPPPVVPSLGKGAKGQLKRKGAK